MKELLRRWRIFLWSIGLSLAAGGLLITCMSPVYRVTGSLRLEEPQGDAGMAGAATLRTNTMRAATEVQVLRSRELLRRSLDRFDWRITFRSNAIWRRRELYPERPAYLKIVKCDKKFFGRWIALKCTKAGQFVVIYTHRDHEIATHFRQGETVRFPGVAVRMESSRLKKGQCVMFRFNNAQEVLARIGRGYFVDDQPKPSMMITIGMTDIDPTFAAAVVNAVLEQYIADDRRQRSEQYRATIRSTDAELTELSAGARQALAHRSQYARERFLNDPQRHSTDGEAIREAGMLDHDYDTRQQMTDFLLAKRLSASIALATLQAGATIIDHGETPDGPGYPAPMAVLRSAILTGIVVGLGLSLAFPGYFVSLRRI